MTEISLILFDLNGVLYHYDRDARIAYLGSLTHVAPHAIKAAIWDSGFEDSGDAGMLDAPAYLRGFGVCIGHDLSEADWLAAQMAAIAPIAATLALLPGIRREVRCAVLTNNNFLVRRHFSALYPEIAPQVEGRAFVSAEFGVRKPDPEVYRRCLARLGVAPEAALFVDDSTSNVSGAEKAGLHVYHYVCPEDLSDALDTRGLLE